MPLVNVLRTVVLLATALTLGGCGMVVMDPSGDVAMQQRNLILVSTGLMLLIIVPVIALTLLFAWRYRSSNKAATYDPEWHHSTQLEVVIWAAPLVIIIALGALTWVSTHLLDPYRPLGRLGPDRPVAADAKPLRVQAVALDWKWLFFYPDYGVATVNELAAPVDVPINFQITSSNVMNSFFVPALAGQIYAMAGMETKLHAVINKAGAYDGFSANYSGAGFSNMRFKFHGLAQADFEKWVQSVKDGGGGTLDRPGFLELERPSVAEPVKRYASADPALYDAILNLCVDPAKMCMKDMMRIDAQGGGGKEGLKNLFAALRYERAGDPTSAPAAPKLFVSATCTPEAPRDGATAETTAIAPMKRSALDPFPSGVAIARRDPAPADRAVAP